MSVRVARDFNGRWTSLFATSYTFELEFFDEYLFRRLGDPPLNATVLVDAGRHARLWERADENPRLLRRANRDYLLRPARYGTGAFHPKTILLGNASGGVLLVGSGNLSLHGLEHGNEVFARFDSSVADDLPSLSTYVGWVDELVRRLADADVSYRWLRLRDECSSWLGRSDGAGRFLHNLSRPILEQFVELAPSTPLELHALAPFYDRDGQALTQLAARLMPDELIVYVTSHTNVNGGVLARALAATAAKVTVRRLEPDAFVHAKLIAAVGEDAGLLLSGSANLSRAALVGALATDGWSNVEAVVVARLPADRVRQLLTPPEASWATVPIDHLERLEFSADDDVPAAATLLLRSAWSEPDGRITVSTEKPLPASARLATATSSGALSGSTTAEPVSLPSGGVLVWITDPTGAVVSNAVPIDDRQRLGSWLQQRDHSGGRPAELSPADMSTPVGRMLMALHQSSIFDLDETTAARAGGLTAGEADAESENDWATLEELLAKEELARDPRVERYRRAAGAIGLAADDDVLALLRLMLDRTPEQRTLRAVGAEERDPDGDGGTGAPWTPEMKLRVRLFNVLQRWTNALDDRRFAWIDVAAPARNYAALLVAVAECWEHGYLRDGTEQWQPPHRIERLIRSLLDRFITSERSTGYLLSLTDDDRAQALSRLPGEARNIGAALLYASLRNSSSWRDYLFDWQPAIAAGLQLGLFEPTTASARLAYRLSGHRTTPEAMEARLTWAAEYLDDEHWAQKQQRDLGIERVQLTIRDFDRRRFGVTLTVATTLDDPGLVSLVRQALSYRHTDGAVIELPQSTRLSVLLGQPAFAKLSDGLIYQSRDPLDMRELTSLEQNGGTFSGLLVRSDEEAS